MARLEVVVLEELLVLQVPVLGLDRVELVAQRQVILVALLDLKDLRLELRDQQVFLVARQVHAVVVLLQGRRKKRDRINSQISRKAKERVTTATPPPSATSATRRKQEQPGHLSTGFSPVGELGSLAARMLSPKRP